MKKVENNKYEKVWNNLTQKFTCSNIKMVINFSPKFFLTIYKTKLYKNVDNFFWNSLDLVLHELLRRYNSNIHLKQNMWPPSGISPSGLSEINNIKHPNLVRFYLKLKLRKN